MTKEESDRLNESTVRAPSRGGVEDTNHGSASLKLDREDGQRRFARIHPHVIIELADESDIRGFARSFLGDISLGGMFVKTPQPRAVGTTVRFRLLAHHDAPAGEMSGEVVRVISPYEVDEEYPDPGMAIQFNSGAAEWLKTLISEYAHIDGDDESILLDQAAAND